MAGQGVTLYANNAAGNKAIVGTIDWRENIYMPSQINDNLAQIMADIRAMANSVAGGWIEIGDGDGTYTATYVSATSFQFSGIDVTAYYRAGMRVRVVAPTPGTINGTITAVAFSVNTVITVAWDSGAGMSNEAITSVSLGVGSGGGATAPASYRNILGRNGGMEVWQRGAGGAASIGVAAGSSAYTADGWALSCGANQAMAVIQSAGITSGSRFSAYVQRVAVQTGVGAIVFEYPLDSDEIIAARGSVVTLSMTLQGAGNWSPAGGMISIILATGTDAARKRGGSPYTGELTPINVTQALGSVNRYTFTSTAAIASNVTCASLMLTWTPVGTAGAADAFLIDDTQLEIGSVATPFERRPFESELAACRRHYWKTFPYEYVPAQNTGALPDAFSFSQATAASVPQYGISMKYPVPMRIAPSLVTYNPSAANNQIRDANLGTDWSISAAGAGASGFYISATPPVSSAAGHHSMVHLTADAGI